MTSVRSFIARCSSAGISEWTAIQDQVETPLVRLVQSCAELPLHIRPCAGSAAFFALGRILAGMKPVAVISPEAEPLAPAIREARSQNLPLLVVTTGEQPAPSAHIVIREGEETDAGIFDSWDYHSPLHVHIRQTPEPGTASSPLDSIPSPAPAPRYPRPALGDLARTLRFEQYKGIVVMIGALPLEDQDPALWIARELGVPVIADATSGLREELANLSLHDPCPALKKNPPGTVLRLGGIPASPFWKELENIPETSVYSVSRDSLAGLSRESHLISGTMDTIARAMGDIGHIGDSCGIMQQARKQRGLIEELILSHTESAPSLLNAVSRYACLGGSIFLSRELLMNWNEYAQWDIPTPSVYTTEEEHPAQQLVESFLAASLDDHEAWYILGNASGLPPIDCGGTRKRVIVSLSEIPTTFDIPGAARIRINSSFDLDQLDLIGETGLTIVEIVPDEAQTLSFYKTLNRI